MSERDPIVPDQLAPLIDDEVRSVHERWQKVDLADVKADMATHEVVRNKYGGAVILDPEGDRDETHTVVLALPHQQGWIPSMAIRARLLQQIAAPHARMVVLPNNTIGQERYYKIEPKERQMVQTGILYPYFKQRTRLLESLDVRGRVDLTGYSLGALTAIGIASVNSNNWKVSVINADEAPNKLRTPKELQQDFLRSGGWSSQRKAINDAAIPALASALNAPRLLADYMRFALSTRIPENAALHGGMAANSFDMLLRVVINQHPSAAIKLGQVADSHVVDAAMFKETEEQVNKDRSAARFVTYSGEGTHRHPTGDNAIAHALMYLDGASKARSS